MALSAATLSSFARGNFGVVPVADVCLEDGETKAVFLSSSLRRDAAKIANKVGRALRPADVNCTKYAHRGIYRSIQSRIANIFLSTMIVSKKSILSCTIHAIKYIFFLLLISHISYICA